MPFGDSLKKEACLSAILTLNLKFPYKKEASQPARGSQPEPELVRARASEPEPAGPEPYLQGVAKREPWHIYQIPGWAPHIFFKDLPCIFFKKTFSKGSVKKSMGPHIFFSDHIFLKVRLGVVHNDCST